MYYECSACNLYAYDKLFRMLQKNAKKKKKPNLHRQASASFLRDLWAVSYIKVAPIYMQNCSVLDILMITQLTENMQKVEETKNEETE